MLYVIFTRGGIPILVTDELDLAMCEAYECDGYIELNGEYFKNP